MIGPTRARPRRAESFGATAWCAVLPVAILETLPVAPAVYADKILKAAGPANLQQPAEFERLSADDGLSAGNQRRRRRVDRCNDPFGLRARNRAHDRQVRLLGFRKELSILHRGVEGGAKDGKTIGRDLLRHDKGSA